ncbi:helix-turn-helix domain-containing protein [Methylobrevis albus]|uniref:Helix-turn-helix transcriptional regulator n=1 Tax=Methylobrevis albus TaxID=2793297 RepID=A0A931HZN4_9HYPH|nr:helix-turn-helix transcriptional regulator [Methylobrevis albus]MBH0236308.1 helix-turn-helix transcriptional regulator [Methylobrevis albus]
MRQPNDICSALKAYRVQRRIKQDKMAEMLGVTQSQISRWERGLDTPRPGNVERIKQVLWGGYPAPDQSLLHFVKKSTAPLLLLDEQADIVAISQGLGAPGGDFERFGWVLRSDPNSRFGQIADRLRAVLANPHGVIAADIRVPFEDGDNRHVLHLYGTIYAGGSGVMCITEVAIRGTQDKEHIAEPVIRTIPA